MVSDPPAPVRITQHAQKVRQWVVETDVDERSKGQLLIGSLGGTLA